MFTDELSYLHHIVAREITNGMWFLGSLFLLASMLRFLVPRLMRSPAIWKHGVDVRLAWGIFLIAAGTAIRAGWIWSLLIANALGAEWAVQVIQSTGWVSYFAIGLGIWGCVCSVKAITEAASGRIANLYLWLYWSFVVAATIAIPLLVNLML